MRSPAGLKVEYIRDPGTQVLQAIRSGQAEITLHYDDQHRIARARGSHGQEVGYEYDSDGRLIRVAESSGVVRRYSYNKRGAMLTVDEPRWHLENRYDVNGRCVYQRTRFPNGRTWEIDVAYKIGSGGLTETTTTTETGGPKTVYHFGQDHYVESKEFDPDGPWPVAIVYLRNAGRSLATSVTIRCYDTKKRLLRTVDGDYKGDAETDRMAATICHEWAETAQPPFARPEPSEPAAPTAPTRPLDPAVPPRRSI
jgi:YD repeat-containing protein